MFGYFRKRRRRKLSEQPFPDAWRDILQRNVSSYSILNRNEKTKLERDLRILIAEKSWQGCAGLAMTDEIKVTIAGQASLLLLGWDGYYFDRVRTILVYPGGYRTPAKVLDRGIWTDLPRDRIGEAHPDGVVVLSWRDSLWDARGARDGRNVVLHEFAHVLDMEDGDADGVPAVADANARRQWRSLVETELEALRHHIDILRPTFLDPYGASNEAELFAVAVEAFFELAPSLRAIHSDLYGLLSDFFCQDPKRWARR